MDLNIISNEGAATSQIVIIMMTVGCTYGSLGKDSHFKFEGKKRNLAKLLQCTHNRQKQPYWAAYSTMGELVRHLEGALDSCS